MTSTVERSAGQMLPGFSGVVEAVRGGGRRLCVDVTQGGERALVHTRGCSVLIDGECVAAAGPTAAALRFVDSFRAGGFSQAVRECDGAFAIALWDDTAQTLWLARDRFGQRGLYFSAQREQIAFASTPLDLVRRGWAGPDVDPAYCARFGASHYRVIDNDPGASPFTHVRQLPAAHVLRWSDERCSSSRYWQLEDEPDWDDPTERLAARYRDFLLDSVKRGMKGVDAPMFTLSGGMDSSSVLGCANRFKGSPHAAISTVYDDRAFDESEEIETMARTHASPWHRVRVEIDDPLHEIGELVRLHGEPVATATWLSHLQLCRRAAAEGATVLFGGLGGDELNAGEYEHFLYHFADLRADGNNAAFAREIECWARHHDHPLYRKSLAAAESALGSLVDGDRRGRCRSDRKRIERYGAALSPDAFDLRAFDPVMDHPFRSYLKNRTWQDLTRETIPCCLRAEDRNARACGLATRLPFLDHRLVEFMFRVRGELKIRDGVSKRLLRDAMQGIVPDATRLRVKKTGWNAPAHRWFSGRGADAVLDLVRSQRFRERGLYRVDEVERLVTEHDAIVRERQPRENHMMFIWQLVNLELWQQQLEESQAPAALASA